MVRERKQWKHRDAQELIHEEDLIITFLKDLQIWWKQHGLKVVLGLIVLLVVILGSWAYVGMAGERESQAQMRLGEAQEAMEEGELDRVTRNCQDILQNYGGSSAAPLAQALLGDAYLEGNELDRAEQAYETYLSRYPNGALAPQVRRSLALVWEGQGKADEALETYQALLEKTLAPPSGSQPASIPVIASDEIRFHLGRVLESQKKYDEARSILEEIHEDSAWQPMAQRRLEWLKAKPAPALDIAS